MALDIPEEHDASAPARRGFLARNAGKFSASAVITVGIWYTLHKGGLKFLPEGGDFVHVRWWTIPVYVGLLSVHTWYRSIRWRFLLNSIAHVPKRRLLAVSWVGFAAILLLPFRIGEIVRPYLIRTRGAARSSTAPGSRPITLTAATSSVVAERVIDGLYLSIVLAIALVLVPTVHPLPEHVAGLPVSVAKVRLSGYLMLFAFAAAFGVIAVFYSARSWAHRVTVAILSKLSTPLAERVSHAFEKFADGLHVLSRGRDALGFMTETSLYWGLNAAGMWLLAWGCGVVHADGSSPTFGEAFSLMGMLGCAVLIPGPPGLLGVFQAGLYAAMTMYYPTSVVTGPGAAFVFLLYAVQFLFTMITGGLGLLMERGSLAEIERAAQVQI